MIERFADSIGVVDIATQFAFPGKYLEAEVCNNGHINDTYILSYRQPGGDVKRFILQRINGNVFKSPVAVMTNIQVVTEYLRKQIVAVGGDPERETLNLVSTKGGQSYLHSSAGHYWRAYRYVEGAQTYQLVHTPAHFYSAGFAFGRFQMLLRNFPATSLHETIPDFHNTRKRFADFIKAVRNNKAERLADVQFEVDFILAREADTDLVVDLIHSGDIPVRVTHNDTKFDNILIDDRTGEGICVIDLDTVMPGSVLYDFGDAIRFGASTGAEDEQDLSLVSLDLDLFEQFTAGYLKAAGGFLHAAELEHLAFSAKLLTLECGMRFLGDHLNGDVYFKVHRPGHNLDRARTQLKLVQDMENHMDTMKEIVAKYA